MLQIIYKSPLWLKVAADAVRGDKCEEHAKSDDGSRAIDHATQISEFSNAVKDCDAASVHFEGSLRDLCEVYGVRVWHEAENASDEVQKIEWRASDLCFQAVCRNVFDVALRVIDIDLGDFFTSCCVTLMLSDDAEIGEVNLVHRNKAGATNVLSFPYFNFVCADSKWRCEDQAFASFDGDAYTACDDNDEDVIAETMPIGDIIISYETITREANENGVSFIERFCHLLTHGILHIFGYDHESDADADVMEALEAKVMRYLGYDNPYAERD